MKCTPFYLLISYHSRTSLVPIHRFRLVLAFMVVTAVLIDFCVTLPRLFRAGLISLHWMLFGKFSLWSLIDMKAFLSVIFSILLSIFRSNACCLHSLLMVFVRLSSALRYSLVMFSLRSFM